MSRYQRVASQLKKEISNILHDDLKDPRIGFITVTGIRLSADLRFATIYYSVLGNLQEKLDTSKALESALGFIRRLIAQRLNLKFTPQIFFREDDSIEVSFRLDEEFKRIKRLKDDKGDTSDNKTA